MGLRGYVCIWNTAVLVLAVSYFASVYLRDKLRLKMFMQRIYLVSKQFFLVLTFFNYAIPGGPICNLLFVNKTGIII